MLSACQSVKDGLTGKKKTNSDELCNAKKRFTRMENKF